MGKIVTKQQFSIAPNSRAIPYPPVAVPTPTDAQIRELLRGYDEPGSNLPNAVLITDSNSKIQELKSRMTQKVLETCALQYPPLLERHPHDRHD